MRIDADSLGHLPENDNILVDISALGGDGECGIFDIGAMTRVISLVRCSMTLLYLYIFITLKLSESSRFSSMSKSK